MLCFINLGCKHLVASQVYRAIGVMFNDLSARNKDLKKEKVRYENTTMQYTKSFKVVKIENFQL